MARREGGRSGDGGRSPVVIVPPAKVGLELAHALIAWKDTRESRRSIVCALPLLKNAARVSIVEVAPESDLASAGARLDDVADWLSRQGCRERLRALARDRRRHIRPANGRGGRSG